MDGKTKAEELILKLKERGCHISTAESCTGGLLAAGIIDVSGASDVFEEGYITYSDRIKTKLLRVKEESLKEYTAVSEQVAREMAEGTADVSGAEITVSVTGYAGPEDGEDGTPAGTVYIGCQIFREVRVKKYLFQGGRNEVRRQAVQAALDFVLECME